jgi:hypothetical protein
MTTKPVHLPESLQRKVETFASEEGISVDEFIASAVEEKLSTATEHYLENRARRGSRAKYDAALAQVRSAPPLPPDRFPDDTSGMPDVRAVGYDRAERRLDVEFESGVVCQYFEVPEEIYRTVAESTAPAELIDMHVRTGPYPVRLMVGRSGVNRVGK